VVWIQVDWHVPVEIFLPSYADAHFDDLERRQDPVLDIVVTDEEVRRMFPQWGGLETRKAVGGMMYNLYVFIRRRLGSISAI
jgi:hypothetical protein